VLLPVGARRHHGIVQVLLDIDRAVSLQQFLQNRKVPRSGRCVHCSANIQFERQSCDAMI